MRADSRKVKVSSGYIKWTDGTSKRAHCVLWLDDNSRDIYLRMSYEDHLEELEENEMYSAIDKFRDVDGNIWICGHDFETDEDYLIPQPKRRNNG